MITIHTLEFQSVSAGLVVYHDRPWPTRYRLICSGMRVDLLAALWGIIAFIGATYLSDYLP
jgi:hypothetical protein